MPRTFRRGPLLFYSKVTLRGSQGPLLLYYAALARSGSVAPFIYFKLSTLNETSPYIRLISILVR